MHAARWTEPTTWARQEAARSLQRGLAVPPTLLLFEGEQPTIYLRAERPCGRPAVDPLLPLAGFGARLGPRRVLAVYGGRLSDPAVGDVDVQRLTARPAVVAEWCAREDAGTVHGMALLPHLVDDRGGLGWDEPEVVEGCDGGALRQYLDMVVAEGTGPLSSLDTADACYAVSRQGVVVGVREGWRSHYGFDRAPRAHGVRPVDRRRARHLATHARTEADA